MRVTVGIACAVVALVGARAARVSATARDAEGPDANPYTPSPAAAPFVSLGYREAAADLLFVRLGGYFGDNHTTATGIADLVDAIVALDPQFHRVYEYGARAMTLAHDGVDQSTYHRAIAVLERGAAEFPGDWKLPYLAGQIYTQDLQTKDPAQRRAWDEKGTLLVESATRKPGAPAEAASWVSVMRTKFGENQRAIDGLHEILLVTTDDKARRALIERLAQLEHQDADEIAGELFEERETFVRRWRARRPTLPSTMYVLLGDPLEPGFDLTDLATGGRDLVGSEGIERLEPL